MMEKTRLAEGEVWEMEWLGDDFHVVFDINVEPHQFQPSNRCSLR